MTVVRRPTRPRSGLNVGMNEFDLIARLVETVAEARRERLRRAGRDRRSEWR